MNKDYYEDFILYLLENGLSLDGISIIHEYYRHWFDLLYALNNGVFREIIKDFAILDEECEKYQDYLNI